MKHSQPNTIIHPKRCSTYFCGNDAVYTRGDPYTKKCQRCYDKRFDKSSQAWKLINPPSQESKNSQYKAPGTFNTVIKPQVVWFYGLSGSGKTTLSRAVAEHLKELNLSCLILDGDELRQGLSSDLEFTLEDRYRNVERAAEIARLACSQGIIVLVAMISPTKGIRSFAKGIIEPLPYTEIFLNCSLEGAIKRDVKGLYARAQSGEIENFTGLDSRFDRPDCNKNTINTDSLTLHASVKEVLNKMILTKA
jgi:adenylyl-sulfate kinase